MIPIRIAFRYDDKRLFARLVTLVRGGDSAHCEVISAGDESGYLCVSASFLDGGVRQKVISMSPEKWRVYALDAVVKPTDWYHDNFKAGYDVLGLLGFVIPFIRHRRSHWFCSEVAANIMGLTTPEKYDLVLLESVCKRFGTRVQ